jgi:hypothetical protein
MGCASNTQRFWELEPTDMLQVKSRRDCFGRGAAVVVRMWRQYVGLTLASTTKERTRHFLK